MFTLDRTKNDTSVTLDLLRACAAQMVCIGHAITFFMWQWRPTNLPLLQNVGVLLFFILSGFLITFTLIERSENPEYGFVQFCIDRFARIYSGLVPALIVVFVIDRLVISLGGDDPASPLFHGIKTLCANLLMLEGYQGIIPGIFRWPIFGSASPLWTLAIEWHIYIFVAAVFFMGARPKWIPLLIPVALFFGQTPVHYLIGAFQDDGVGRGLFALWLGGALIYFAARWFGAAYLPGLALAGVSAAGYVALIHTGEEYRFRGYPLLLAAFFGLVIATQAKRLITSPHIERTIRFFANYSFSLYLVHHTVLYAERSLWPDAGIAGFVTGIILANIVAIGVAEIGEKHHRKLARLLTRSFIKSKTPHHVE